MGATFSRVKTWTTTEDVTSSDLNAEFNNILDNLTAAGVDDFSANVSQMQTTADPGEVGTESLATSVAGEISRLRHLIGEITGEDEWYESPVSSLLGLANAIGTATNSNRLVSGRVRTGSAQPIFLVPNGAARTIKLDGTPTNFKYYVNGTEYTISSDVTLTNLTAAPSSNNTCLVDDTVAADQDWTKFTGENGTSIPVDTMGSEISALVGKFAAFKIAGTTDEYFLAHVTSTTSLTKARRGLFFDSSDNPVPRAGYTNNDTITLLKLTWVYAKTDGTIEVGYTNPTWGKDEPSSPAVGDFWFDTDNQTWKKYSGTTFAASSSTLVGICVQDTTNTIGARSFEFFLNYDEMNTFEVIAESNSQVKTRLPGKANVWGTIVSNDQSLFTWDMTLDLDSGVVEGANTDYYFYLTEEGDKIISDVRPYNRFHDLRGFYHPYNSWRCVGYARNNGSSNLSEVQTVEGPFKQPRAMRTLTAATLVDNFYEIIPVDTSGGAFSVHLPPAATCPHHVFNFRKVSASDVTAATVDPFASETIAGASTKIMRIPYETMRIRSDGTNWILLSHTCPEIDSEIYLDDGNGHGAVNTRIRRFTNITRDTSTPYMTYADSANSGMSVTVNVPGQYHACYADRGTAATCNFGFSVNGSALTTDINSVTFAQGRKAHITSTATGAEVSQVCISMNLSAGDIVRAHTDTNTNNTADSTTFQLVLVKPKLGS